MRIHRIHLTPLQEGERLLLGAEAHHLARVLRVRAGQEIRAFDGDGLEARGVVLDVEDGRLLLKLEAPGVPEVEPALDVTVAMALLKGDKLADVVRQCTELGATAFQPFLSRHADVRELAPKKLERLQRVATEAAKQCGRALVPRVLEPVAAKNLAAALSGRRVLVADPEGNDSIAALQEAAPETTRLAIVTGSEGGFADTELQAFREEGFGIVRLGNRILRAETAPVAMLAALLLPEAL